MKEVDKALELIEDALSLYEEDHFYALGSKASIYSHIDKKEEFYFYLEECLKEGGLAKNLDSDILEKHKNEKRFVEHYWYTGKLINIKVQN